MARQKGVVACVRSAALWPGSAGMRMWCEAGRWAAVGRQLRGGGEGVVEEEDCVAGGRGWGRRGCEVWEGCAAG